MTTSNRKKQTLSQWQSGLEDEHLRCRDLHHSWQYQSVKRVRDQEDATRFIRRLQCTSCKTFKIQSLDGEGYVLKTSYEYPEGYVRPAESGRVTARENAKLRLQSMRRNS